MVHLLTGVALGAFFVWAGLRKWNSKADAFAATMRRIGYAWAIPIIPLAQLLGGLALVTGFLSPLAALGLIVIMVGAFVYTSLSELCEEYLLAERPDWPGFLFNAIQKPEVLLAALLAFYL